MKKSLFIFVISALISSGAEGQQGPEKMKLYDAWIKTISPAEMHKGYVYEFQDDSITLVQKDRFEAGKNYQESELKIFPVKNIDVLSSRKKGSLWKGTLIGFGAGFLFGGIIGFATYEEDSDEMELIDRWGSGLIVAIPLGLAGAGIGTAIGASRVKHPMHGNEKYYERVKEGLQKRSVTYYYR